MTVRVYSVCRNEEKIIPFFLRHYTSFADSIVIYDDESTDKTLELLSACPIVEIRKCPWKGLNDVKGLEFSSSEYKESRGKFTWVMWVDMDEFIWSPNVLQTLLKAFRLDIPKVAGFNMVGNGLPMDDGRQIWEINPMGVRAPVYSKQIVFRPEMDMNWSSGRHHLQMRGVGTTSTEYMFRLLHYRYMGFDYTRTRNRNNLERCGRENRGHAWSCEDNYKGEHSAEWAESVLTKSFNVLEYSFDKYDHNLPP